MDKELKKLRRGICNIIGVGGDIDDLSTEEILEAAKMEFQYVLTQWAAADSDNKVLRKQIEEREL